MTVIAHLSDLHFGADDRAVVAGLVAELNADPPDMVAISGDLTQGARRHEFAAARRFIESLRAPVLAVPGNHDITAYNPVERFVRPYARWTAAISAETEPLWRDRTVAVLGINTAHRAGYRLDWSRGRFSRRRVQHLLERLDSMPRNLVRIVVAHHPILASEDAPNMPLAGKARETLAAFAAADVRLVLSGHGHRAYARASGEGPLIVQCATTTSVRLRGDPNAYNRITIMPGVAPAVEVRVWTGSRWSERAQVQQTAKSG